MVLRRRYPHHYHYFANRSFTYAGREIAATTNCSAAWPASTG
jgi:hypothetical protein